MLAPHLPSAPPPPGLRGCPIWSSELGVALQQGGAVPEQRQVTDRRGESRSAGGLRAINLALPVASFVAAAAAAPALRLRRRGAAVAAQRAEAAGTGAGAAAAGASSDVLERSAVVVGGGPAGLASALMLAKRDWAVTVLERREDPSAFDPGRGFLYLIDWRGQKSLRAIDDTFLEDLKANAVPMTKAVLTRLSVESVKTSRIPFQPAVESYWIPRHVFTRLLAERVRRSKKIEMIATANITEFHQLDQLGQSAFEVRGCVADGTEFTKRGTLLLGTDGIRSQVRDQLEKWDASQGNFQPKEYHSDSAGLRYKVLTLPNGFDVETGEGQLHLDGPGQYAVYGAAPTGRQLRLGLLPVRDERKVRTGNLITFADDPVWKIRDAEGFVAYAREQWPHFPLEGIVSQEELQRFAADEGGYFPRPQHSPRAAWAPTADAEAPAAALLGDSLHAFPPDLGQGVNSALEDVSVLDAALEEAGDAFPAAAARAYSEQREPDAEALVKLQTFCAPYQYGHMPLRAKLWTANFMVRFLLSKLLPGLFPPPSFFLIQRLDMSYSQALRVARRGAMATAWLGAIIFWLGVRGLQRIL